MTPTSRQMSRRALLFGGMGVLATAAACASPPPRQVSSSATTTTPAPAPTTTTPRVSAVSIPAATAVPRATIPCLTYHQIRPWASNDTKTNRETLICPPSQLALHLDAIKSAGWTTITADEYVAHLAGATTLPSTSVLLSFDDGWSNQASVALPLLTARGLRATFFVTTRGVGAPGWLSEADIGRMAAAGMEIAAHTYDHAAVTKYRGAQWAKQLQQPREYLQKISGQEVAHFAYPYGVWRDTAFEHLSAAGYDTAFQLIDKPLSKSKPLFSLRRILAPSTATGPELIKRLTSMAATGV